MQVKPKHLIPLRDMVVVLPVEEPTQTPSGLHLPERRQEEPATLGIVESVGPGYWEEAQFTPTRLVAGDMVLFAPFAGLRWQNPITKQSYVILRERDIHCAVAEDESEVERLKQIHETRERREGNNGGND